MSGLQQRLERGERVITAEFRVVDGADAATIRPYAEPYARHVAAISVADNPGAHAHASSLAVSAWLGRMGTEPIMNLSCRDRNRLALQADLLGAGLLGIENILCVTGDDVLAGDQPETRRVFDLDSVQLLSMAGAMTQGRYLSGRPIAPSPKFFLGAVENPGAPPREYRPERALKKVRAGARFLILQSAFAVDGVAAFLQRARQLGLLDRAFVLPSVCVAASARGLRHLGTRIPGMSVPLELISEVEGLPAAEQRMRCLAIAEALAYRLLELPGVSGLHVIDMAATAAMPDFLYRLRAAADTANGG